LCDEETRVGELTKRYRENRAIRTCGEGEGGGNKLLYSHGNKYRQTFRTMVLTSWNDIDHAEGFSFLLSLSPAKSLVPAAEFLTTR